MRKNNLPITEHICGKRIEDNFGMYSILCKTGTYCSFGNEQISNQLHYHNSYELCVILSGYGKYIYNDKIYELSSGDLIIADPGVKHEIQGIASNKELLLIYFFINIKVNSISLTTSQNDKLINNFLCGHKPIVKHKEQLFAYLNFVADYNSISISKGSNYGTYLAIKNLILESLLCLSNHNSANASFTEQSTLEQALDYIDAKLHTKISVESIAKYCCTSKRNLEYLFKNHLSKTIIGYINEKKIELACHYLSMYYSISDTSALIGISDCAQFSRLFKKYKGVSPKKYQEQYSSIDTILGRRL
ncbi:helix-turn-helix domain-containing protein [Clostridium thailandense]|uniref:helix-turn-helix domain-containing protein n=1 Tax=Clostridium thailandense TaxID=2794346 RepID=UPI00398A1B16